MCYFCIFVSRKKSVTLYYIYKAYPNYLNVLMNFIHSASVLGTGLLVILLFSEILSRGKVGSFTFLILVYISLQIRISFFAAGYLDTMPALGALYFLSSGFSVGPLLLVSPLHTVHFSRYHAVNFIVPGVVFILETIWFTFDFSSIDQEFRNTFTEGRFTVISVLLLVLAVHMLAYLFFFVNRLFKDLKKFELEKSYWGILSAVFAGIMAGVLSCAMALFLQPQALSQFGLICFTISGFIAVIGHFKHPDFFLKLVQTKIRYSTISLSKVDTSKVLAQVDRIIIKEEEYKNSNLRIETLAHRLGIHRNQLSRIVNEQFGCTFNEFVNRQRLAEAKFALVNTKEQVITIAFDVGFNSASVFNAFFKKETGLTPIQYRKKYSK